MLGFAALSTNLHFPTSNISFGKLKKSHYAQFFSTPAVGAAVCAGQKMDKKASCLNEVKRSETKRVSTFSHFLTCTNGNPEGAATCGRFLLLTFLWRKQRKVSSCRSITDLPSEQKLLNVNQTHIRNLIQRVGTQCPH
jgi:hypothetical protein